MEEKSKLANEVIKNFKELAKKYNFKTRDNANGISLCAKLGYEVSLKTLIDPEDWQEIANIHDAYDDPRYSVNIEEEEEL